MRRYDCFKALLSDQDPSSAALVYFEGKEKKSLSYAALLEQVAVYEAPKEDAIGLFVSTDVSSIVSFFALASKKQLILLNPEDSPKTIIAQIEATHIQKLLGDYDALEEVEPYLCGGARHKEKDILFFTSGTTSAAKAVVLDEKALCHATYNGGALLPLKKEDSLLSVLPYSHVFGLVCSLLWPLSFGASVCLGRGLRSIFFDFAAYRPTATCLVPQMAEFLTFKKLYNPELKLILIGAGTCKDEVLQGIKAMGIRVSYGYGLTETSSGVALSLGDDPRQMTICPDYEIEIARDGEILIHGSTTLMKGYYEDKASTKKVLCDGVLKTGDLGHIKDGYLYLDGRKKEILVFDDGSKVYLPEYEGKIASLLPPDADFAILQGKKGQIVLAIHKPQGIEAIVDGFNTNNPLSHQITKIQYCESPLPRTHTGKVQRYLIPIEGE